MEHKIHWGGGLRNATTVWTPGYPCCCSGRRAEMIKYKGSLTTDPDKITCKMCANMVRRYSMKRKKDKDENLRGDPTGCRDEADGQSR